MAPWYLTFSWFVWFYSSVMWYFLLITQLYFWDFLCKTHWSKWNADFSHFLHLCSLPCLNAHACVVFAVSFSGVSKPCWKSRCIWVSCGSRRHDADQQLTSVVFLNPGLMVVQCLVDLPYAEVSLPFRCAIKQNFQSMKPNTFTCNYTFSQSWEILQCIRG